MANKLFGKKPVSVLMEESGSTGGLKRTLGRLNLITLGTGAIIGAGVFVLTGRVAAQYAGPALALSFVISGVACGFAGLCYAEFASMIPISGSAYTYAYATMGRIVAWIIAWALILEYLLAASTVAAGWSGYFNKFLHQIGGDLPAALTSAPFNINDLTQQFELTGSICNLPAIGIILLIMVPLYRGVQESATINNAIVILKLTVVFLFILLGWQYVDPDNWVPFIPEAQSDKFGDFGWTGVLRGASIIFFAYLGFDAVSTAAQEAKNPQRDMPWGILGSLIFCTLIYIVVSLVMTGMVPYKELNSPAPISVAIEKAGEGLRWFNPFITVGAIAGLSSVILVMLMGQTRIFLSMSNDGLFFKAFAKIHPKYKTPYLSTLITGTVAMILSGLLPIEILGDLVSFGTLLAFTIVCIGVMVLRYKRPDLTRPFKVPLFPVTPILGVLSCLAVMASLGKTTHILAAIWIFIGMLVYVFYGRKHAKY